LNSVKVSFFFPKSKCLRNPIDATKFAKPAPPAPSKDGRKFMGVKKVVGPGGAVLSAEGE
jgi:hypothetical protein